MNTTTQVAAPQSAAATFFAPIGNTKPFFKAAFEGFAGTGKTYTAATVAVGLHKRIQSTKPIVIFDTERASKFLKPLFAANNIDVLVREAKSLADLKRTMDFMRSGVSDILLIDSISHVWEDTLNSYQDRKYEQKRTRRLEMLDWGIIKPAWKKEFSDRFVSDEYHAIFTGRAGFEYGDEKNEDTGKREIFKTGIKMKVEGETAYEPDMLVLLERFEEVLSNKKEVWREATIIKDRSTLLDGKTFRNPTYEDFAPAIEALLDNPVPRDAFMDPEGNTAALFESEENVGKWKREKDKAMEEIEGLLARIAPGATGKDKTLKLELLDEVFGTTSMTGIGEMKIDDLRAGYRKLMEIAVEKGLAHWVDIGRQKRLRPGEDPASKALGEAVEGKPEPPTAPKRAKKGVTETAAA